jgi:acetyl-CoA decarbonylase/synthase, CODH/ACS complex subunit gamma
MAMTGIQIFKLLPKTNCKECGFPTCLAFAMALAAGKTELAKCPHVSEESKAILAESSAPPIRTVEIGTGEQSLKVGGELVLFRHEKTFYHPPGLGVLLTDEMDDGEVGQKLDRLNKLEFERVGLTLKPELAALQCVSGDAARFEAFVRKAMGMTGRNLIIMAADHPEALKAGVMAARERKPLIYAATRANAKEVGQLGLETGCPVAVKGANLDEAAEIAEGLIQAGLKDLVIDSGARDAKTVLRDQVAIRRLALEKKFAPLGFPTLALPCEMTSDVVEETLYASMLIAKYAGLIILSDLRAENLLPLLIQRLNIYTDPQRPMATKQGIYEIGSPNDQSPVLVTTNFSLTYFIVSGEIESSRVPSWLLILDTEGLSVMTAWAAGKFAADAIAAFVRKCGIQEKVTHRNLIIPGYAAGISGELEDELKDWKILIGPREAAHLAPYLRQWKPLG